MSKEERKATVRVEIEERPKARFDLLHVALPLPHLTSFGGDETRQHLRAAHRERLLALRSLLDAAIKPLEESERPRRKVGGVEAE
jgi:hypothetical protein